jgi:CDP-glucose 4,6-dehydratase
MTSGGWRGRRVLVTGATGLVGGWVVAALLEAGAEVTALVRDPEPRSLFNRSGADQRCSIVTGELESLATVERAVVEHEVETVIHLAAQAIVGAARRDPLATFEANVRGSYNLLDVCRRHHDLVRRIVIASSDKAYGDHGGRAYDEEAPLVAEHPYDVSKACAEMLARSYARSYDLPITIARCGNVYGGGDLNWSRIVPGTIRSLLRGERPVLRSDGTSRRDYLYARDAATAYLALADAAVRPELRGQAFNFSNESPTSVLEMVQRLIRQVGRADLSPVIENNTRGEIPHQAVSARKARDQLGWRPTYDLERGLAETVEWYRDLLEVA